MVSNTLHNLPVCQFQQFLDANSSAYHQQHVQCQCDSLGQLLVGPDCELIFSIFNLHSAIDHNLPWEFVGFVVWFFFFSVSIPASSAVGRLPIRDCAGSCNNCMPERLKLSAIYVTAKAIFECLYLVPGLSSFGPRVSCSYAPTPPPLIQRLFLDFCAIFWENSPFSRNSGRAERKRPWQGNKWEMGGSDPSTRGRSPVVLEVQCRSRAI